MELSGSLLGRATLQSGESAERGRSARRDVPRSAHGEWQPHPDRPDPIDVLRIQAATRVQELPGPWEWDVKRMAASAEIAGRDIGTPEDRRRRLVTDCVREYREAMRHFAAQSHLDVWYERINASELVHRFGGKLGRKGRILFTRPFARARRKTSLRAVTKLTEHVDGELRFRHVPPLLVPFRELFDPADKRDEREYVQELVYGYREGLEEDRRYLFDSYRLVDLARKVVGVGSVGTRAWIFLLASRGGRDPLVLQAKEARASVLEPYLGASEFHNHGERVVRGQRMAQAAIDLFLSWQRSEGLDGKEHDFYVRQLWDWKASVDLSTMTYWGLHPSRRARTRAPAVGPTPSPTTATTTPTSKRGPWARSRA